tara:strand:+ start:948 stop:2267 length:1320 start_codon:yes stop_codon:yes gene_type:complete
MATYSSIRYVSTGGGGAGVTVYANFAAFPASPSEGDLAYANDTDALYVRKGSSWNRIDSGEEAPVILTEPPTATQNLAIDGTTKVVTMTAQDPEGFGITYGIAYATANNARPTQLSADTTINQGTGAYTFTPSTTQAHAGNFKARLSASDGAKTTTRLVNFGLSFNVTLSYLVVAGGGAGGKGVSGGGGGAGGLLYSTSGSFPLNTNFTVAVGAGGAYVSANADGNAGANSSISGSGLTTITAIGGGGGGGQKASTSTAAELAGGSGGGGTGYNNTGTVTGPGGNATSGQGNAGGTGSYGTGFGGGGGGAGQAGGNHNDSGSAQSKGGDGLEYSISGTATYYAGGGGGGGYNTSGKAGGQGGAGNGGSRAAIGGDATANTGGGGGGVSDAGRSGAGGSGIVIIRAANTYSASGSGFTETTSGSDKIWTFTGNGTITFSS